MLAPPIPADEAARLAALRSLDILDTQPEERFDRYTRMARRLFGVPLCLVSLVDAERQWFKSRLDLPVSQTPRDVSFCAHAILGDDLFLVPDALNDPRFHDNPLVLGDPGIRFYAGYPLRAPDGSKLGSLCLLDLQPRELDDEQRQLLRDLGHMVEHEIAAVHMASMDHLTHLSNRRGFEALAQQALNVCRRVQRPAALLYFDLNDFKPINDRYGHAEGDRALVAFAEVLRAELRDSDVIGRLGGDEFAALLTQAGPAEAETTARRVREALHARNRQLGRGYDIHYSVGHIAFDPARHDGIAALLADADAAMYSHKRSSKPPG